jgi:hypothetical protein
LGGNKGHEIRAIYENGIRALKITDARGQMLVAPTCNTSYSGAEIRRIVVQSQPRQMVHKTLSQKNPSQKGLVQWLKW